MRQRVTIKTGNFVESKIIYRTEAQERYRRSGKRAPRSKKTSEKQKRANDKTARKQLARLIVGNFTPKRDHFVTLTFAESPSLDDLKRALTRFISRLRVVYKAECLPLKYVYVIEVGEKGRLHVHMVLNNCTRSKIKAAWTAGTCDIKPLKSAEECAEYLSKAPVGSVRWVASKNLNRPVEIERVEVSETEYRRAAYAVIHDERARLTEMCGGNKPLEAYTAINPVTGCKGVYYTYFQTYPAEQLRKAPNYINSGKEYNAASPLFI